MTIRLTSDQFKKLAPVVGSLNPEWQLTLKTPGAMLVFPSEYQLALAYSLRVLGFDDIAREVLTVGE